MRLIVWGAGELGGRVIRMWPRDAGGVVAYTRTTARHEALATSGAEPRCGSPVDELRTDDALLLALPGTAAQAAAVADLGVRPVPRRVVLISSTGFHAGASGWVDEDSAPGTGERAAAIAACESAFLAWAGAAGAVLRCGGLYRAGRGPLSVLRRSGVAPPGPPDTSLALVHYDDAAAAACAALQAVTAERVYLCVTEPCPTRREYWEAACRTLGVPAPEFGPGTGRERVRYDTARLRRDLLPDPVHPDWTAAARA